MKMISRMAVPAALLSLTLLGGCATSLNEQDQAKLDNAVQTANDAKATANEALAKANAAAASADQAAASAQAAAANAQSANEKVDRIFQRSLRK